LFVSRKHGESGFFSRAMSPTIHMCQEASSTYRPVTSFLTNWNFFTLSSLFLTNRTISESAFLVLKTHPFRAFLRTNTESKVSTFFTAQQDRFRFVYHPSQQARFTSQQARFTSQQVSSSSFRLSFRLFCVYNSSSSSSFSRLNRVTRHTVDQIHIVYCAS
jgi:hypothetical protein